MHICIYEPHLLLRKQLLSVLPEDWVFSTLINSEVPSPPPDIMLVGLSSRSLTPLELIKNLKKTTTIPILAYAIRSNPLYGKYALLAGADSFVNKDMAAMATHIQNLQQGELTLPQEVIKTYTQSPSSSLYANLSAREIEILSFLAAGLRNADIAEKLELSQKTVSTYKSRLMKKLELNDQDALKIFMKNHAFL